jgi:hypothetical protein
MKNSIKKSLALIIMFFGMLLLNSCNKHKAAAIMEAAKNFSLEAIKALDHIGYLNDKSSMAYSIEDMQKDQVYTQIAAIEDSGQINTQLLNSITEGLQPALPPINAMAVQIERLKEQYIKFSTTFDALFQGNFFAAKAVKKTEAHAIRLTVQLIELAEQIERTPYQFTRERSDVLSRIYKVKNNMNTTASEKSATLEQIAGEIIELAAAERNAKNNALLQCLKAAERGKTVAELAKNYKKMSLGQMLNLAEGPMSYSLQFLGDQEVGTLMNEYMDIKSTIEQDPYWGALIGEQDQ